MNALLETQKQLNLYWQLHLQKQISAQDLVALFWLSYYHLFPNNFSFQIHQRSRHLSMKDPNSYSFHKNEFILKILNFKKNYQIATLYELFNCISIKYTKSIAIKALCLWYQNKFELVPLDYIPLPIEVLKLQTQGKRCISLLRNTDELIKVYEHGRNVQEFLIHDLEHAWQMFSNPQLTHQQIKLSSNLLKLYEEKRLDFLLENSTTKQKLEYVFSDMNSHPEHTLSTLNALVLEYFKTINKTQQLEAHHELDYIKVWNYLKIELLSDFS